VECDGFALQRIRLKVGTSAPAPLRIVMEIAELKETLTVDKSDHQVSTEPGENMDVISPRP